MGKTFQKSLRQPWSVLAAWLALACVSMALSPVLAGRLTYVESPPSGSESSRAGKLLKEAFPAFAGTPHLVVLNHPGVDRVDPLLESYLAALRGELVRVPGVRTVTELESATGGGEGQGVTCVLVLSDDKVSASTLVPKLRAAIPLLDPSLAQVAVTGPAAAAHDLLRLVGERLGQIERISFVLSAFALYCVFGGALPVGLALVSGLICLATLPTLLLATSLVWPATGVNLVIAAVVSLALGLDYALLFLGRLREEFDGDLPSALHRVQRTAGRTILVSALAVAFAGLAVLIVPLSEVRSAGLTMVGAAALAAAAALWLIPALLTLYAARWPLGPRIAIRRPWASSGALEAFVRRVTSRPRLALAASLLVFAALAAPAFWLATWSPFVSMLPQGLESRRGLDWLHEAGQAGAVSPFWVVWEAPVGSKAWDPEFLARLGKVSNKLRHDLRINQVRSPADVARSPVAAAMVLRSPLARLGAGGLGIDKGGRVALMRVVARPAPDDPKAASLVAAVRRAIEEVPGPGKAVIAGMQAEQEDIRRAYHEALPWVLGCTVLAVAALVGVYLRSVVLPLKAILTNLIPVLCGLGVAVAVFQLGWAGSWSGLPGEPLQLLTVAIVVPLLYALSMDYELFILARIKEEHEKSGSHRDAVARGLARSGPVVAGAALVMLSVFLPYLFVGVRTMQELGLTLSVAILLDATLVRWVLVPAVMTLMGERNFWLPRFLGRDSFN